MKSTGECLGIARTFNEAFYKAFLGAGIKLPKYKNMILTVRDEDKPKRQWRLDADLRRLDTVFLLQQEPPKP